ncbi:nicotinate-nucleotide diphosphorylase (carboxylating) [Allostella sp. ATCC 35155]|nr:nicotinate-nucleotide diphosphorylase (carboxylating) [Stella sp. ATCC 35155]
MATGAIVEALPDLLVEPLVRAALLEDLGRAGDITTAAVVPADAHFRGAVVARQPGVVAGIATAAIAFRLVDPAVRIAVERPDGSPVAPGDAVLRLDGPARAIITAERVALNFLCHLSGIATATAGLVAAARPHPARITCTRKTTPGLRALEKHAVRAGGGVSHRFGLDDGVLIKDNHIAVAGGVAEAVRRARRSVGHMVKVEVEVDDLDQLAQAMAEGPDAVLLDNMPPEILRRAVAIVAGRAVTEASGRITAATVGAIAATGVDIISAGWITHSAPALDLGLDAG